MLFRECAIHEGDWAVRQLAVFLLAGLSVGLPLGAVPYGLPPKARVLEVKDLRSKVHSHRALMLWMLDPEEYPLDSQDPYTCPDETAGSHYRGPTRVSLLDTSRERIINTIEILNPVIIGEGEDALSIPYQIRAGYYYHVPGAKDGEERKPTILWLQDYNGDGKAQEFALFHKLNCTVVWTTLIGYSESQDRVINYPVTLEVVEGKKRTTETSLWIQHMFAEKPKRPGQWDYKVTYMGGCTGHWQVKYDPKEERFKGRKILLACD